MAQMGPKHRESPCNHNNQAQSERCGHSGVCNELGTLVLFLSSATAAMLSKVVSCVLEYIWSSHDKAPRHYTSYIALSSIRELLRTKFFTIEGAIIYLGVTVFKKTTPGTREQ